MSNQRLHSALNYSGIDLELLIESSKVLLQIYTHIMKNRVQLCKGGKINLARV